MSAAGGIDFVTLGSTFCLPNPLHSKGKEMAMTNFDTRSNEPGHNHAAALLSSLLGLSWGHSVHLLISNLTGFKPLQSSNSTLLLLIPFL